MSTPRTIQDFAKELSRRLECYLAIGLSAKDIEWVIVEAMQGEVEARPVMPPRNFSPPRPEGSR